MKVKFNFFLIILFFFLGASVTVKGSNHQSVLFQMKVNEALIAKRKGKLRTAWDHYNKALHIGMDLESQDIYLDTYFYYNWAHLSHELMKKYPNERKNGKLYIDWTKDLFSSYFTLAKDGRSESELYKEALDLYTDLEYGYFEDPNKEIKKHIEHKTWNPSKIKKLVEEKGASPNTRNSYGNTILAMAVIKKDKDLIRLLIKYKGDPEIENTKGWSAKKYAERDSEIKRVMGEAIQTYIEKKVKKIKESKYQVQLDKVKNALKLITYSKVKNKKRKEVTSTPSNLQEERNKKRESNLSRLIDLRKTVDESTTGNSKKYKRFIKYCQKKKYQKANIVLALKDYAAGLPPEGKKSCGETYKAIVGQDNVQLRYYDIKSPAILLMYFKHLKRIDLGYNKIESVATILNYPNLEELNLSGNKITDIGAFSTLKKLKKLNLNGNRVKNFSSLSSLRKLKELTIRGNRLKDISSLANLKSLSYLDLSDNEIEDISPLSNLRSLEHLNLEKNYIRKISSLSSLRNLKELNLKKNQLKNVAPLSRLTGLKELNLLENMYIKNYSPLESLRNTRIKSKHKSSRWKNVKSNTDHYSPYR